MDLSRTSFSVCYSPQSRMRKVAHFLLNKSRMWGDNHVAHCNAGTGLRSAVARLHNGGNIMQALRLTILITAAMVNAGMVVSNSTAQDYAPSVRPAESQSTGSPTIESLGARFSEKSLGLKAPFPRNTEGIALPFGMNYSRDSTSLLLSIDPKNDWGIGLNLDVNSSRSVELAPSIPTLGLQPKRTPGLMLQKKF